MKLWSSSVQWILSCSISIPSTEHCSSWSLQNKFLHGNGADKCVFLAEVSEAIGLKGAVRLTQNCLKEGEHPWCSWWTMVTSLYASALIRDRKGNHDLDHHMVEHSRLCYGLRLWTSIKPGNGFAGGEFKSEVHVELWIYIIFKAGTLIINSYSSPKSKPLKFFCSEIRKAKF